MRRFTIILVICCIMLAATATYADSFVLFTTDVTTGWYLHSEGYHVGKRTVYYKYGTSQLELKYSTEFRDAVANWGSYINLVYSASTTEGNIVEFSPSDPTIYTQVGGRKINSAGHTYSWEIRINNPFFEDGFTNDQQINMLTTEIGRVYGLAYRTSSSYMMYHGVSTVSSPSTKEKRGIEVVSHQHEHPTDVPGRTYSQYSAINHKSRCNYCYAYNLVEHTYTVHGSTYTCSYCGYMTTNPGVA